MLLEGVPKGEEFSSCPGGPVGHPKGPKEPAPLSLPVLVPRDGVEGRPQVCKH